VKLDVLGLGEPMVEFSQIPGEPGRYLHGFGGDTMNAVIAAARQGARTGYVTRLGADEFGQQLLDLWRRERGGCRGRGDRRRSADGRLLHHPRPHGARLHLSAGGFGRQSARAPPACLSTVIAGARFLHVSGISQAISATRLRRGLRGDRSCALRMAYCISYDSNLRLKLWPLARARAIVQATIPLADCFLPSLDDVQLLSGLSAPEAIFDWALALGARSVALKLGPAGRAGRGRQSHREHIPACRVDVVDASGAGDCFAGALLARLAAGDPLSFGPRAMPMRRLRSTARGTARSRRCRVPRRCSHCSLASGPA
jgi:2-dehydro-3-deoxygluconokinase